MEDYVKMYNEEGLTLQQIAEKLGTSKSTVGRHIKKLGYEYDKSTNKYIKAIFANDIISSNPNIFNEPISNVIQENTETNVSRETTFFREPIMPPPNTYVNRTYAILEEIDRALRIKSAIEGKKVIDIVREALNAHIEDKYKKL